MNTTFAAQLVRRKCNAAGKGVAVDRMGRDELAKKHGRQPSMPNEDGDLIAYKHDDFTNYIVCADSCCNCDYQIMRRFDICSSEYTTDLLDYYPKKEFLIMPTSCYGLTSVDISSRPQRRQALSVILKALSDVLAAEMNYFDRIPPDLRDSDAHVASEESIFLLSDAISVLSSAY